MAKTVFFRHEDFWAIGLGFTFLTIGLALFFGYAPENYQQKHQDWQQTLEAEQAKAPYKTVLWHETYDAQQKLKAESEPIGQFLKKLIDLPSDWKNNPIDAFVKSNTQVEVEKTKLEPGFLAAKAEQSEKKALAVASDSIANANAYKNETFNRNATAAIAAWREAQFSFSSIKKKYEIQPFSKLPYLLGLMVLLGVLFGIAQRVMSKSFVQFLLGFVAVFGLGLLSLTLEAQAAMKMIGFASPAWAIAIGMLIANTIGTPNWLKPALCTELYIKTGLVLLGAEILLGKILAIGLPGIFVAWVTTPIVLITTYWFGQNVLKIPSKTLNITVAADMSVCGVSAAVATAAACKATKEELTLAIGLSMVFTSIMMVVMPAFINWVGMSEVLGGAWIGGTIDSTGAVVAAGAFLGDDALTIAATIKMIQNILIGFVAFGVAIYFTSKVHRQENTTIGASEIWKQFPKFILGFMAASVLFSLLYEWLGENGAYTMLDQGVIRGFSKNLREWLFVLAFASIGLSTNFKELRAYFADGKALTLYVCGQALNLLLTLIMAYIMFYLVFPNAVDAL